MSQVPVIGIDLGTTNSVVSYTDDAGVTHVIADENGDRIVPSVIHFTTDGEIVVGHQAREYASTEIFRYRALLAQHRTSTLPPGVHPIRRKSA